MKRGLLFLILFLFVGFPSSSLAHVNGQSVFRINDILTTVDSSSSSSINEAIDKAPQAYMINEPLNFEIDISKFPTPKDIFEKTNFIWDFGDGNKEALKYGFQNTHVYNKVGIYTLNLYADYTTAGFTGIPEPQLLQSVVIEVKSQTSMNNGINPSTLVIGVFALAILITLGRVAISKK